MAEAQELVAFCILSMVALPLGVGIGFIVRQGSASNAGMWIAMSCFGSVVALWLAIIVAMPTVFKKNGGENEFEALVIVGLSESAGRSGFFDGVLRVDRVNIWLVGMTSVLSLCAAWYSLFGEGQRALDYYGWLLVLESGALATFLAESLLVFYVAFEFTLVPLLFIIGMWGGPQRRQAALKFMIYTLAGSLLSLIGIVAVAYGFSGVTGRALTFSISDLLNLSSRGTRLPLELQYWAFLALAVGFGIKVPVIPLHTWLPAAHVEAPTAGSVLLAGVMLKLGAFGLLRMAVPLLPDATRVVGMSGGAVMAAGGIVYGALCAGAQEDIKRLVAYSSISHMGLCVLGLVSGTTLGVTGGVMQMINHGLITGALFILVGCVYTRVHKRNMSELGGLAKVAPRWAGFFVFFCLAGLGLPGLNGFVSELLTIYGTLISARVQWGAFFGLAGIVLSAWYLLTMVMKVCYGETRLPTTASVSDLNKGEFCVLMLLASLCIAIGLFPGYLIQELMPQSRAIAALVSGSSP